MLHRKLANGTFLVFFIRGPEDNKGGESCKHIVAM